MKRIKSNIQMGMIICFLFYLTCYLRFIGQAFLETIVILSAISITIDVYTKSLDNYKKELLIFWKIKGISLAIVITFYTPVMNNDFLQIIFITIIPNLLAFYFMSILTKLIHHSEIPVENKRKIT